MHRIDAFHLGGCRAAFCIEDQGKLMDIAVTLEECVASRCGRSLGTFTVLVIARTEELCKNATCGPEVYLYSVVCISVQQLGGPVVAC